MAEPARETPSVYAARQNALAEIRFASIVDGELTPSEDETPDETPDEEELQLETVQSAIGVSIGQQQTRLTSPKTPAAEKAAALDDTDGGVLFEGWQQLQEGTSGQNSPLPPLSPLPPQGALHGDRESDENDAHEAARVQVPQPVQSEELFRLPSPWRAGPKTFERIGTRDHRSSLRETFTIGPRRRAMSGGTSEALKKYIPFNMPSMPKTSSLLSFSLPSFSVSSFDNPRPRQPGTTDQRKRVSSMFPSSSYSGIPQYDGSEATRSQLRRGSPLRTSPSRPNHTSTAPIPQREFTSADVPATDSETTLAGGDLQRRGTPRLRKSNSEGSLLLYRQRSFASSLGDDTRFEHVSEQVNSRLKALKDSWQDANFKLPSLPTMSNFGFGPREDLWNRSNRSGSLTPKAFNAESSSTTHKISSMANSNPSSRGIPAKLHRAKDSSTSIAGMNSSAAATHPYFTRALEELTGDVVILGGYRGSVLRSAEPPNRQLWVPIKVGLNLRKVDLELGLDPEDEETEEDRIIPAGMLTHIGPVDIAKRLLKRLRACDNARRGDLRVHNYGYDWRLSPHILSRKFLEFLRALPCNQPGVSPEKRGAVIIAHSFGGLMTRHAVNQDPSLFAGVVYAGVPQTCVNILGPLRNGDDVLLSSRVLTAQVNFTIRTSYALLPLDGKCFINKYTKEEYPVDFFDPNTWSEYRLSPCIAPPLPHPNTTAPPLLSASGLLNAMSQALPSLPGRKSSISRGSGSTPSGTTSSSGTSTTKVPNQKDHNSPVRDAADVAANAADKVAESGAQTSGMAPQMGNGQVHAPNASNPATTVTIPYDRAFAYLTRTLAAVKKFKSDLSHIPAHTAANAYPPVAVIYGKSTPTVYGAKVESREAIKRADAYDELAFASGDGVVLARAAMVPEGYSVVRGGVVSSDRGHVTLLGDLEAVGRCLVGVLGARGKGVGMGNPNGEEETAKQATLEV